METASNPGQQRCDIADFLQEHRQALLDDATMHLSGAALAHYDAGGPDAMHTRLRKLLDTLISACSSHRLDGATAYASGLARLRQAGGFQLGEVQAAVNALEASVWRAIATDMPAPCQSAALATVATVFGAIKDRVGCEFVAGASHRHSPAVDIDRLFEGTEANLGTGGL